jgi:hypothetical protein
MTAGRHAARSPADPIRWHRVATWGRGCSRRFSMRHRDGSPTVRSTGRRGGSAAAPRSRSTSCTRTGVWSTRGGSGRPWPGAADHQLCVHAPCVLSPLSLSNRLDTSVVGVEHAPARLAFRLNGPTATAPRLSMRLRTWAAAPWRRSSSRAVQKRLGPALASPHATADGRCSDRSAAMRYVSRHGRMRSNAALAANTSASAWRRPMICMPTGRPSSIPAGMEAAG